MVEIRELGEEDISRAIELSLDIFKPKDGKSDSHHTPSTWKNYLRNGGILLGAFIDNELIGFLMGRRESSWHFHAWMGGVRREFRRKGTMTRLLKTLENKLKGRDYKPLSINTYQEKSPGMFALLKKEGFEARKTEKVDWHGRTVVKSCFGKNLGG